MDPFYTTKTGKRTGLGLSLFRASTELAGGSLTLGQSPLGGLAVEAAMQLRHVDRLPLGDLAATFFSAACTNPDVDFWCRLIEPGRNQVIKLSEISHALPPDKRNPFRVAQNLSDQIRQALASQIT